MINPGHIQDPLMAFVVHFTSLAADLGPRAGEFCNFLKQGAYIKVSELRLGPIVIKPSPIQRTANLLTYCSDLPTKQTSPSSSIP
jgi:hypothetical protein